MRTIAFFLIGACIFLAHSAWSQADPEKACRMEDGKLVFTLDKRWNASQKEKVIKTFDLDSALVEKVLKGEPPPVVQGATWTVTKIDANLIELSKPLKSASGARPGQEDVTMLDDRWITATGIKERESAVYGMNMITRVDVFSYKKGVARFFLPGNLKAREVYLAGSFNAFSTSAAPMVQTDSGWVVSIRLKPGKYLYKYVIDGRWTRDPFNRLREDDTYGDYNSVVFCYNHIFYLRGYKSVREVTVAGSFNGWNDSELHLQHVAGGWIRAMYLREGTHSYKFIIDGNWILDPANKVVRPDGRGNFNSFIGIGDTLYFRLPGFKDAEKVYVAGNFNEWNPDELGMRQVEGGWELPYVLADGNYYYKFVVDGKWMTDPSNPYATGPPDFVNSFLPVKPNHHFVLDGYTNAKSVIVTGSFNNWSQNEFHMAYLNGKWTFPIHLDPGKHTYKFIVDGEWMIDPGNKLWEENEFKTGNSVLWIGQ